MFSSNFAEDRLYQETFQPIEDIIPNRVIQGDRMTAIGLIAKIERKMSDVPHEVNKRVVAKAEGPVLH